MRGIARRFEHRLFLSATPHNGHSNSFSALLEILDPDRFCRGVPPDDHLLTEVMVRRLKSDLRELSPGDFPERRVVPEVIDGLPDDAPELALSRLLQHYRELREARLAALPRGQKAAGMLVVIALQKRLLSSIEAFACTLRVHRRAADKHPTTTANDIDPQTDLLSQSTGADDERAELPEDEVEREETSQLEQATTRGPAISPEERDLLAEMARVAEIARHQPDARVRRLFAWLKDHLCPALGQAGAPWLPRRVLLFTEYADTKRYLMQQLAGAIEASDQAELRIGAFHGGMGDDAREKIKLAFNADPQHHPLRILVATDAAREGVNLQNHCADLFHFDVPWNPSRMEQRNGRIDRKLQRAAVVHCRYFVLPQRAEDRVLDVLVRKTATIQRELGSLSPVVERDLDHLLRGGIAHAREAELSAEIAALEPRRKSLLDMQIERELEQVRQRQQDLKLRVGELRGLLAASRAWLGLDDEHFRGALSAALGLLGADPLQPLDESEARKDPGRARWQVPALHRRAGADPSWAATLDALRAPRKKQQTLGEWRRDAPIRPVVFHDPGNLDGEVVHLHLEHRVVQRLLGRVLSQGFVHDEISRACVCRSDDPEPRLLILGRLSLYGPRAARLHDEILAVAAGWVEPDTRRKKLRALPVDASKQTLADLEKSLVTQRLHDVPAALRARLQGFAAADLADLLPQLETRARERLASAEQSLKKRGEQEAVALAQVIAGQIDRIHRKIAEHDGQQLGLDFRDEHERRQIAADRRFWDTRLPELAAAAIHAPAAIRDSYIVQAVRVEPVGLVYLWPVSA